MRAKKELKLKDQKVAIIGTGISGFSALKLCLREKAQVYAVNQGEVEKWPVYNKLKDLIPTFQCLSQDDPDTAQSLASMNLIIISPGIPREHPVLEKAHLYNVPIWGEVELGYYFVREPLIAITGTNGKTTTVSLLGDMLKRTPKKVFIGGNIGTPLCDFALSEEEYDIVLLELSSFQLESVFEFRADLAAITNLSFSHGERYDEIESYAKAKWQLAKKVVPKGHLFYDKHYPWPSEWISFLPCSSTALDTARAGDMRMILNKEYDLSKFSLVGDHNIINLYLAVKMFEMFNKRYDFFTNEQIHQAVSDCIANFKSPPHRVQLVSDNCKSYMAFNDSKSTNWKSTDVAVKAMESGPLRPLWLIVGGQCRGGEGESITPYLEYFKQKVDKLLLFGDSANKVEEEVFDQIPIRKFRLLDDVIRYVDEENFKGILLFSPAFPSFDLYSNYEKRGEHFLKLLAPIEVVENQRPTH